MAFEAVDVEAGLALTGEVELADSGLLRMRHRLRNTGIGPYVVDGLHAALPVPGHARELLDLAGRWAKERRPQRRPLGTGAWVREVRRGRTGHDAPLGLFAGTEGFGFGHGEVWGLHVAWSGNHVSYAERMAEGTALLGGGELLLPGEIVLDSGEEYATPWLYAAYSGRGLDGVSSAFHGRLRSRPHHPGADRPRPVVINTWEAVYFDHDLDRLRELADRGARIGAERFVLDDGWFRHRRDDSAGLGDWYVDETVWPNGLEPLISHVRGLGMEFGLWVEPEMVNPDSDLYRAHPDWVLRRTADALPPSWRNQQVLDLANPEAYAHILERLDSLLEEYEIGYLKWDHNRDLIEAGHEGRPGVHAQTAALYRLMDELRARHPGVEIESCSSGGGRIDLEILERTDRVWASDCIDALERQSIQLWTGLLLPPELVGSHIGAAPAHTTGRVHGLGFRAATALFGHFGIEWDVSRLDERELSELAGAVSVYKELRGLLHSGDVVRADHIDPSVLLHGVVAADRSEAVFCYARTAAPDDVLPAPARLPGLDGSRRYRVSAVDPTGRPAGPERRDPAWVTEGSVTLPGAVLASAGVPVPLLAPEQAFLLRVRAVD
ncbi:alpha-galactosidase [Spinactinospora alkalitolerans]|uniref:alpha-galactosidase n=1 Tax=Spinactinospora alkalitolerans TaxID=687207 RepID=A0A852TVV1_9ACTN|nr:alpha-galactosidase [Spinactinospora alkalitolerans]NYE46992.1 alpha-galactosidase [Spinactinospora alkalitolerans]